MNPPIPLDDADSMGGSLAQPIGPDETSTPDYPQITLSHPDLANFPNSGKAVITHSVVSRHHEIDKKGKHHHRVTLAVKNIRPMGRKLKGSSHLAAQNAMKDMMENESIGD